MSDAEKKLRDEFTSDVGATCVTERLSRLLDTALAAAREQGRRTGLGEALAGVMGVYPALDRGVLARVLGTEAVSAPRGKVECDHSLVRLGEARMCEKCQRML